MLSFTYISGTLHIAMHYGGRRVWVPCANLTPVPSGGVRVRAMGKRPALRALRARKPQVQACRVPATHPTRVQATRAAVQACSAHPATRAAYGTAGQW